MLRSVISIQNVADLGQRYDIIFEANQDVGNYWMRAVPASGCSNIANADGIRAIVRYEGGDDSSDPTSIPFPITDTECKDETGLVPILPRNVGTLAYGQEANISVIKDVQNNLVKFAIDGSSLLIDWDNPTLLLAEASDPSFPTSYNVIELNGTSDTVRRFFTQLIEVDLYRGAIRWTDRTQPSCTAIKDLN